MSGRFDCDECGESYPTREALNGHMKAHSKRAEIAEQLRLMQNG